MTQDAPSTTPLLIRPFKPEDHDAIVRLNAYGLKAARVPLAQDHYGNADITDLEGTYTTRAGGHMLVGEVDGALIAMGGIRRVGDTTCELLRMRVYPEHQGRGYGSVILEALEEEASRLGYRYVTLITGKDQHPAIDLYLRHGYQIEREETLIGIKSVHMSKDLAA
jgi:ribosomal protein S18 acetylase RimI-like enzyme